MESLIIDLLLISTLSVTFVNYYHWKKFPQKRQIDYLSGFVNFYLGLHSLYGLIMQFFFSDKLFFDRLAPFALLYPPLAYFGFVLMDNGIIKTKVIIKHIIIFSIFLIFYIIILLGGLKNYIDVYLLMLNIFAATSFAAYALWVLFYNTQNLSRIPKIHRKSAITILIVLIFVTLILVVIVFSRDVKFNEGLGWGLIRILVYGTLLFLSYTLFKRYRIKSVTEENLDQINNQIKEKPRYEKSILTDVQLEAYAKRIEDLMEQNKIYLNQNLSLEKLANLSHIPKHHLTQVLNTRLHTNFHEYVNAFRVEYACEILKKNKTDSLDNVALQSGFNSKVSFNRHFKTIKNCTPSEFRKNNYQQIYPIPSNHRF